MWGPEFGVTFPSWFVSSVCLAVDCLLGVTCVCYFGGDLWGVTAVFECGLIEIVSVEGD